MMTKAIASLMGLTHLFLIVESDTPSPEALPPKYRLTARRQAAYRTLLELARTNRALTKSEHETLAVALERWIYQPPVVRVAVVTLMELLSSLDEHRQWHQARRVQR